MFTLPTRNEGLRPKLCSVIEKTKSHFCLYKWPIHCKSATRLPGHSLSNTTSVSEMSERITSTIKMVVPTYGEKYILSFRKLNA